MRVVNRKMPDNMHDIYILPLADLHIGEASCDLEHIKKQIEFIKNNDNVFTILNGDIIDNSIRTSIGDVYAQKEGPQDQLMLAQKLLEPIKDKILAINNGNHEERTYRDAGIDLMMVLAANLGLENVYCNEGAFIYITIKPKESNSKHLTFMIYCTHGRGGGRKEGAKAIRLADMASIIDADIYIHSHTHMPMCFKNCFFRPDIQHKGIYPVEKLFVNTASAMDYAKYAEKGEFKPNSKTTPIIHLFAVNNNRYKTKNQGSTFIKSYDVKF